MYNPTTCQDCSIFYFHNYSRFIIFFLIMNKIRTVASGNYRMTIQFKYTSQRTKMCIFPSPLPFIIDRIICFAWNSPARVLAYNGLTKPGIAASAWVSCFPLGTHLHACYVRQQLSPRTRHVNTMREGVPPLNNNTLMYVIYVEINVFDFMVS